MFIVQICGFPTLLHAKKIVFLQLNCNEADILHCVERILSIQTKLNNNNDEQKKIYYPTEPLFGCPYGLGTRQ